MSKEMKSKHNPSNVVAKLIGLETLSKGEPNLSMIRSQTKDYSQDMYAHLGWPLKHWKVEDKFMTDDKEMLLEVHRPSTEQIGNKDGYETWLQSQRGRWREDFDEGKMALVRQKFIEAKYLSTDETLRQSKQFEDALDILSSNNVLLVRFLDSQKLYQLPSTPPDDSNCITLIKPLKMFENDKSSGKGRKNDSLGKVDFPYLHNLKSLKVKSHHPPSVPYGVVNSFRQIAPSAEVKIIDLSRLSWLVDTI